MLWLSLGGTGLAISKSTKHLKTALKYSFWVASANCQRELYYDSGGQPGNVLAWRDDKINENCNNFFKNTLKTLEKVGYDQGMMDTCTIR